MPTIYYKDSKDTWQPLDIGNIKTGHFNKTSGSYSKNFDEPFAERSKDPVVVANALGTEDVHVTATSRNGFTVNSNGTAEVMYFAAQGEIITYENANGEELLEFYFDECKSDQSGAQRVATYFVNRVPSASWTQLSQISQLAAVYPSVFSGFVNKTKTVNMGSYGGNTSFRIAGVNHDTISGRGALTFIADKRITTHQMNDSSTTDGGWANCVMRSWLSGTVLPAMPADLRAVIATVNKVNTSGYGTSPTQDKLWIPSYTEVGLGGNEGSAYGIFTDNSSRIRNAKGWWLRSVHSPRYFHLVESDGTLTGYRADITNGVVPGFCI